ncbi:MAG: helix-turn-helix transcriptional regulator [Clostridia bacterium]|nr:helix-turn-helix transcriptional regulator [Clostridia bacterium]
MHYLDYNEQIQHKTGDLPLAYYPVDMHHERYRMPMHWHRESELIRIRQGQLALYIDDHEATARAGDLMLIAEGVIHGGEPEDCVYECVVFDAAMLLGVDACARSLKGVLGRSILMPEAAIKSDAALHGAMDRLFGYCEAGVSENAPGIVGALYELFGAMTRLRASALLDTPSSRFGQKAEQLKPALEYIETHYSQAISLETLARLTGMSPKYFCRFFRTIVHRSPIDYVNYYRVECASHFLSSGDMTVAEIAQHCGYNDSSFFIKQFRKYKGLTPKQYRLIG